ncbi:2-oxo-4-hydroxy-4-carboxy-5-ureidoimidazoline decarboxylase [Streptomyces sp. NPDC088789]|uniref:2-oxo-4-hydroxy-4-carboxy-5-ureidoimidazoline decarboxylase n=1 Tax=Streptomyces sp. NPDC088789 TaxID=3365899 RepID=UPI0037F2EA9D
MTRLLPEQTRLSAPPPLHSFNAAPAAELRRALLLCLRSPRWAERLTAHRPYPDVEALFAASDEAAYDLTSAELADALAGEPLPTLPDGTYSAAHTALSAAHAAYESRFGHVFVVCLDHVPPDEALAQFLAAIRSRLTNDPEDERVTAWEELRQLAKGRLVDLLRDAGNRTDRDNSPAPGHGGPPSGQDRRASGQDRPASVQDRPASDHDGPASVQDRPTSGHGSPAFRQGPPVSGTKSAASPH